jgi:hypothetical protein
MTFSRNRFVRCAVLFGVAVGAASRAPGQSVSGVVVDSATGRPIAGATVVVRSASDSVFLRGGISGEDGRFEVRLPRQDSVVTSVRRIGLRTVSAAPVFIAAKATHTYRFAMTAIPLALDTVRTAGKKVLRGMFYELTAGQEWFARHSVAGKGFFISGLDLRLAGMTPCDFFAEMPGFEIARVLPTGVSSIACYWHRTGPHQYVIPMGQATCLEAYVDRQYRLIGVDSAHFVTTAPGSDMLRWQRLDRVRGIELFARYEDRPQDFSAPSTAPLPTIGGMSTRVGMRALLTNAGEPAKSTNDFSRGGQQRCALILVWTEKYWGS